MNGLLLFSHSIVSDSLQPHGLQHARPPCPSLSPEFAQTHVHWVSDTLQPSYPLSSPSPPAFNLSQASGSFPASQLFTSGGQSIGASASASVLPVSIQGWFPLRLTGLNPGVLYCWQILYCLSHQGNQEWPINGIKLHTLPSMQEMQKTQVTWVQPLGWEDLMEKEMASHPSILAWEILWTEEPGGLKSTGSQNVRHDLLSD